MITQMGERPPYVQFETRAVEDRDASIREGRYMAKNVDYALITPAGSKDVVERVAEEWLAQIRMKASMNPPQVNLQHANHFEQIYEAWKKNNTLPEDGTPIKGWQVITPAEQVNILSANVRTVEDLAVLNEQGLQRIGMGARNLQEKAKAWLKSANDHGKVTNEMAAIKVKMENQEKKIDDLTTLNARLINDLKAMKRPPGRPVGSGQKREPML